MECVSVYGALAHHLLGDQRQPIILVDWCDLATTSNAQLLRAARPLGGRAITLYEEVHPLTRLDNPKVHRHFLKTLKTLLPETCQPIVVTDAGFRNPWFKAVEKTGWHWVGRVRNRTLFQPTKQGVWSACKHFYARATPQAKTLGDGRLAKSNPITCTLYVVRKRKQARLYHHSSTLKIVKAQNREREPWLLASSLRSDQVTPKQVVAYYRTRMQIEEAFRDTKSVRYGFCLRHCNTTRIQRLKILLLIAALAHYCALLLGLAIQQMKQAYRFQANTNSRRAELPPKKRTK